MRSMMRAAGLREIRSGVIRGNRIVGAPQVHISHYYAVVGRRPPR
jgi:hypothetical protein